jgi:hypothetical protein
MPAIKLHLEWAELDPVTRLASELNVKPEVIAFTALNRLMLQARSMEIQREILEAADWHRDNLPLWSDSASSVHAYEAKPDAEPERSRYV